ncbi:interleukin-18 receptor 1-like [Sphaeramia orbicularis]|uniref:Interleukin-18 receptor 1-like n=1 Tax=Sphaeramia orbicularis TaxID=375764 RepID=A0A673APQ4_9TELE|nr:interleukin-18 receptor 1-like [Sphaeramia orbicularis]
MKVKETLLVPVLCLFTLFTGMCPVKPDEIYIKSGEMVALHCDHESHNVTWSSYTTQGKTQSSSLSSSEQNRMGILIHRSSFIILNASVIHQGNYSCSLGNTIIKSFRLAVYSARFGEYKEGTEYPVTCYMHESCTLTCPGNYIPDGNIPNITSNGIIWQKGDGRRVSVEEHYSLSCVHDRDQGVYICTRSYLYQGQIYNMTSTRKLTVKPEEPEQSPVILFPRDKDVFYVDLGSPLEVNCTADQCSEFDSVYWLSVDENKNSRVFFYATEENTSGQKLRMTASLVFKKVLEEDLFKNFSCKLDSTTQKSSVVTITLARKARRSYVPLAVSIVVTVLTMALTVVIYIKYKISLTLFIRDTLGCHRSISDGKSYDGYLMCYKSDTDAGLNTSERKWLEDVLEDRFGYNLCLNDRDVLPGQAIAETVLDCVEQSRTVILVPTSPDPGLESGLLTAIHEALVERQTRLVLIRTEATEGVRSGSLGEVLHLLSNVGHCVTWKGKDSEPLSSSFWKQLRYYLPPAQHSQKIHLLPQTV